MSTSRGNALRRTLLESKPTCRNAFSSLRGKAWLTLILFGALATIVLYAAFYFTGYYMYLGLQERIVSNTRLHTIALIEHRIQQFQVCTTHTMQQKGCAYHTTTPNRVLLTACSGTWTSTRQQTRFQQRLFTTPSICE